MSTNTTTTTISNHAKAVRAVLKTSGHDLSAPGMLDYVSECFVEGLRDGSACKLEDVTALMLTLMQEAGGGEYTVRFIEYGKPQRVTRGQLVLESQIAHTQEGGELDACAMCGREMRLTRHHLIPRTTHSRLRKQFGLSNEQLCVSADICRPCHDMVHRVEDEMTLARHWNTIDSLKSHPKLKGWIEYASRQKVRQKIRPTKGGNSRAG
eukprot:GDKI01027125.1.p1 GENE.GDKI01027125.1~~GDKI01027125.1.p1  ORF type:complete len:209 (-),score=54.99 GDKI01027125.1:358-984(-)